MIKKGWKHYQAVGRGLFSVHLTILHFKFQFSKSVKSSTFHIFLNLTYPLRKNLPKCPKIYTKLRNIGYCFRERIWCCLKCEQDIGRKTMLSNIKTAFRQNPALSYALPKGWFSLVMEQQSESLSQSSENQTDGIGSRTPHPLMTPSLMIQ